MDAEIEKFLPRQQREPDVSFHLPGPPQGKGRPRTRVFNTKDGRQFASHYTDAETRSYEAMLRYAGEAAMRKAGFTGPMRGALRVRVTAVFSPSASWSQKKKDEAIGGYVRPTTKPDWENIAKTLDGVNGVVWQDDSQIVEGVVRKFYGDNPGLHVEVWKWTGTLI